MGGLSGDGTWGGRFMSEDSMWCWIRQACNDNSGTVSFRDGMREGLTKSRRDSGYQKTNKIQHEWFAKKLERLKWSSAGTWMFRRKSTGIKGTPDRSFQHAPPLEISFQSECNELMDAEYFKVISPPGGIFTLEYLRQSPANRCTRCLWWFVVYATVCQTSPVCRDCSVLKFFIQTVAFISCWSCIELSGLCQNLLTCRSYKWECD